MFSSNKVHDHHVVPLIFFIGFFGDLLFFHTFPGFATGVFFLNAAFDIHAMELPWSCHLLEQRAPEVPRNGEW